MAHYLETAQQLKELVNQFMEQHGSELAEANSKMAVDLGMIINLTVRCNPRQSQGVVRKNIVETAMTSWCTVTMSKEHDTQTQRSFNRIHIKKIL